MMYRSRSRAFALPLVLIVLLVGGALVYVTYEVVLNLFSSSRNVVEKVELYNAALDGVERAKTWIRTTTDSDGRLPRWSAGDSSGELQLSEVVGSGDQYYEALLVRDIAGNTSVIDYSFEGIQVQVDIYDMGYSAEPGIDFREGFPPRLIYQASSGQMSEHMSSTYVGSNRGEGSTGAAGGVTLGYYLIRSVASFEGKREVIDQSMIMRF